MNQNRKNLLVTFADRNFIPQVKALFSSAYFKGGWDGDYMVLTSDMTEQDVKWFEERGIIVNVKSIPVDTKGLKKFPATIYLVFYIFSEDFKKWDQVVYLDVDILIRGSLKKLTEVDGFAAAYDNYRQKLKTQFLLDDINNHSYSLNKGKDLSKRDYSQYLKYLKKSYSLNKKIFNAGVMAFSTKIIKKDTFDSLLKIYEKFGRIVSFPPQGELNLLFYGSWQKLPLIYNVYPDVWQKSYKIKPKNINGVILHFAGGAVKPWDENSYFYREWRENFGRADQVDINSPQQPVGNWTDSAIQKYCDKIRLRQLFFDNHLKIDRQIGLFGLWLKVKNPKLYFFLKKHVKR